MIKVFIILFTVSIFLLYLYKSKNITNENFQSFEDYMDKPTISYEKFKEKIDQMYLEKRKKMNKKNTKKNNILDDLNIFFDTNPKGIESENIESFEDYKKNIYKKKGIKEIDHYDNNKGAAYPYLLDNTLVPNEYYEDNTDLKYQIKRNGNITYSNNQIEPISEPEIGKKNDRFYKVPVITKNTTRNPGIGSNKQNYIIPNPSIKSKIDETTEKANTKESENQYDPYKTEALNEVNDEVNELLQESTEEESILDNKLNSANSNNIINSISSMLSEKPCKFVGSYKKKAKCPAGYKNFTGASVGIQGANMVCNNKQIQNSAAKAIPIVKDGKIQEIVITYSGNNYKKEPEITIIGDGNLASAQAIINNGKVVDINVNNQGKGYKSTPKIEISNPDGFAYCHLCCKI